MTPMSHSAEIAKQMRTAKGTSDCADAPTRDLIQNRLPPLANRREGQSVGVKLDIKSGFYNSQREKLCFVQYFRFDI